MDGDFLYLNRDNRWADFSMRGIEVGADGVARLLSRPLLRAPLADMSALPDPDGPCGIAVGPDGGVYYADPQTHRVMMIASCDASRTPVPILGGEGSQPGEFIQPRGVLFHAERDRLLVADSFNQRVQLFDARTFQFVGAWSRVDGGPLRQPWSLASDPAGSVYVLEHAARRIHKFDISGTLLPAFSRTLSSEIYLAEPIQLAVGTIAGLTEIFILDARARKVVVVDADGHHRRSFALQLDHESDLPRPLGLAVASHTVYVGDIGQRQIFTYGLDGTFAGAAVRFEGPVAGLAVGQDDELLVHLGSSAAPIALDRNGGYATHGCFWGGPFENLSARSEQMHRLRLSAGPLVDGAHLRLHLSTSRDGVPPPVDVSGESPFGAPDWVPQPLDVSECVFPGSSLDKVWVGVELSSEGLTTPLVEQARLDFDHQGYISYLPAIYREEPQSRQFLKRFLSLFESLFADTEWKIGSLPETYDPHASPAEFLAWLAGWLALDLQDEWPEEKQRAAIATAFELYASRGTPDGLRRALKFFAGVDARIDEPVRHASCWVLPASEADAAAQAQTSMLGFTTMLAAAEPQGAVAGSTAILDQSHLITQEEFGTPLFEDVAHTFSVQLYRGQAYSQRTQQDVTDVIEREKPAHTTFHVCVVEPRMRLGFQARLGVDTIVAGQAPPVALGRQDVFVSGLMLGGPQSSAVGRSTEIGRTARLGDR